MRKIILIFIILQYGTYQLISQQLYLKKVTNKIGSFVQLNSYYEYNEDWHLLSRTDINSIGDTTRHAIYENERCVQVIFQSYSVKFEYSNDTVYEYNNMWTSNFQLTNIHILENSYKLIKTIFLDENGASYGTTIYEWEGENCMEATKSSGGYEYYTYDPVIKNPYYNDFKYFRGAFYGSINQPLIVDSDDVDYEYTIISSEAGYPTEILFYATNSGEMTLLYEYYPSSGLNESIQTQDGKLLNVKYYSILGEEINKPLQGFYIEKTITTKGTYSKKYFIN